MPNSNESGRLAEVEVLKLLQEDGYTTGRALRSALFRNGQWLSNGNGILHCVDIIAKRKGERMRFVQVTSIGRKTERLQKVPWDISHESVEIWRRVGGEGKLTDGRTGRPRPCMYFQVYLLDDDFKLDASRRVFLSSSGQPTSFPPAS